MKVNTLKLKDPDYPLILEHIAQPPQQLFWVGANPQRWLNKPRVAVVGSRKLTTYGRTVTEKIVSELARAGVVIISGLAYGIDGTAHQATLATGLDGSEISSALTSLELGGHIRPQGAGNWLVT